jgi:REP element-mobilizing transposase RayT
MARKPRLFLPDAVYHVYCRVARGEFVFDDAEEAVEFVEIVRRVRDLDGWKVLAWCLMGNHYHLVVRTASVPLWRSMLRCQADVARGFNRRRRFLGRLWQSRYRARIIDSQDYFRQVVSYVHLNPVAAGVVGDPCDYRNCGHGEILGRREPRLIDVAAVLRGFEGESGEGARQRYLEWVRAVAEARWFAEGVEKLPWWKEANDVDEIITPGRHPEARTFDGRALEDDRLALDLYAFASIFETLSGHAIAELASALRGPDLIRGRVELTTLGVGRYGLRARDIATLIGKHPSSVSRWLNLGRCWERKDSSFRDRLDLLDWQITAAARDNASMRRVAP